MKLVLASILCLVIVQAETMYDIMSDPKFKPSTLGYAIPGRYIIEFDADYRGSATDFVSRIQGDIGTSDPKVKTSMTYESSLFRGLSISLQGDALFPGSNTNRHGPVMRKILGQRQVKRVYPVVEIPRPKVQLHSYNTSAIEFPKIRISKDSSPLPFTHKTTQVDKVHDLNMKGEKVIVGIIDTGIDYLHPAFGGGFGPGFPVQYGYDLVGDNFDSQDFSTISESPTPLDSCKDGSGHGTHVAGIIAANDKVLSFTGVSPNVILGSWRVFGCGGSTSNDLVIKALLSAHEAGKIVLGSPSNWADDPTSLVADRISEQGSIVVAAAGNEGNEGAFYISAPGSGKNVVSVASVDNTHTLTQAFELEDGTTVRNNTKTFLAGTLVSYSSGESLNDGCNGTRAHQDLTGHIVLVQRGACTLDEKVRNIQEMGAKGIVLYNDRIQKVFRPRTESAKIPVIAISLISGQRIKRKSILKPQVISQQKVLSPQKVSTGNQISVFSSVGPLYDMSLKPDIAAPGGHIFSTLPLSNGGYGVLSGTSMASPFVAGALALFMQVHGTELSHTYIKEHFQNYANPVPGINPIRQGAGLIQVFDAINQPVHVTPGYLSFNDTKNTQPQTFSIHNPTKETIGYKIQQLVDDSGLEARLMFSKQNFSLQPGQTLKVMSHVQQVVGNSTSLTYGGHIQLISDNPVFFKTIQIPYIGVHGNLDQNPIFADGFPRAYSASDFLEVDKSNHTEFTIMYRLITGTPRLRTEVLDASMQLIGIASDDRYIPRNTLSSFVFMDLWNATMIPLGSDSIGDLQKIPQGSYYLRWKALKLLSDPEIPSSWETHLSQLIDVK